MEKFKIKYEAIQYFDSFLSNKVEPLKYWKENNISENALEKVGDIYITYGIKDNDYTNLSGWKSDGNMAHFHFTLHSNMDHKRYKFISDHIPTLLKIIQNTVDNFLNSEDCDC